MRNISADSSAFDGSCAAVLLTAAGGSGRKKGFAKAFIFMM